MSGLYKSTNDKIISGVCSGLSHYLGIDVTLVRIVVFLLCIFAPFLIIIYIIMACMLPEKLTPDETSESGAHPDKDDSSNIHERRSELIKIACYSGIVGALALVVMDIALGQKATFTGFIRYALMTGGILLFISAFSPRNTPGGKKTKITVSLMIIVLDALALFNNMGFFVVTAANIKMAIYYTWPFLVAGLGATILFRGKSFIKIMWILLAVFILAYAVLINMGIYLF